MLRSSKTLQHEKDTRRLNPVSMKHSFQSSEIRVSGLPINLQYLKESLCTFRLARKVFTPLGAAVEEPLAD